MVHEMSGCKFLLHKCQNCFLVIDYSQSESAGFYDLQVSFDDQICIPIIYQRRGENNDQMGFCPRGH